MVEYLQYVDECLIAREALDSDDTLGCRWQHFGWLELLADARAELETLKSGRGQHDGIIITVVQFSETRVDVAAQWLDDKIRTHHPELCLAPQA